ALALPGRPAVRARNRVAAGLDGDCQSLRRFSRRARLTETTAERVHMDIGYDRPLYILPFDHRASFEKGLFGFSAPLGAEQTATVAASKQVVYDGLKHSLTMGVP